MGHELSPQKPRLKVDGKLPVLLGHFQRFIRLYLSRLPQLVLKTHSISPGCYLLHFCCQRMWWVVLLVVMSSPGMLWLCWLGSQESALFPHSLQVVFALGWLHTTIRLLASWLLRRWHFQKSQLPSGKWWHIQVAEWKCFFFPTKLQLFCFRKPSSSASFHYLDADANSLVSQPPNSVGFRAVALKLAIFWRKKDLRSEFASFFGLCT